MFGVVGRAKSKSQSQPSVTVHQVVAYNFRRARELMGWTQSQTSEALEPFLGYRLNQAGVSAIEKTFDSDRRRNIDVAEVVAFARCFNKPVNWFFLPPEGLIDHLVEPVSHDDHGSRLNLEVADLLSVALGRPNGWQAVLDRLESLMRSNSRRMARAIQDALHTRPENYEEQINLRRSTVQQVTLVHQMNPGDEAVVRMAQALIELVKLTPEGYLKLRDADPDQALKILADGDRLVAPFLADAAEKQASGSEFLHGYDLLEPIDPAVALGLKDEG